MLVKFVSSKLIKEVIRYRELKGLFISKSIDEEGTWWVAVDNSTGHAWTEEFSHLEDAYNFVVN